MKEPPEETIKRMADLLIQRGFATGSIDDDRTQRLRLFWTPRGQALVQSFRQLFRPNGEDPETISMNDVKVLSWMLLFVEPDT